MNKTTKFLLICSLIAFANSANALITLKLNTTALKPTKGVYGNICQGLSCDSNKPSDVVPLAGLGGDVLFQPEGSPVAFGARYEKLFSKTNKGGKGNLSRTAAILNYKFIDGDFKVGGVATLGLKHSGSFQVTDNGTDVAKYNITSFAESFSLGADVDFKIPETPLVFGGEAGYLFAKMKKSVDEVSGGVLVRELNLSGVYAKVFIGVTF